MDFLFLFFCRFICCCFESATPTLSSYSIFDFDLFVIFLCCHMCVYFFKIINCLQIYIFVYKGQYDM